MDALRLAELLGGEARPAPLEAPIVEPLRRLDEHRAGRLRDEYLAVMKVRRLEKLLSDSPRFRAVLGYSPYGVIVYEPVPEEQDGAAS